MSQSEAGPSRHRRKYAARACNACRRRKCKCDGIQPVCQPCITSGHECTWKADGEESNRPATKQYIEVLRTKIENLEAQLAHFRQADSTGPNSMTSPTHDGTLSLGVIGLPTSSSGSTPQLGTLNMRDEHYPAQSLDPPSKNSTRWSALGLLIQPPHQNLPASPDLLTSDLNDPLPPSVYQYIFNIDSSVGPDEQLPEQRQSLQCQWNRYLPGSDSVNLTRHEHDTLLYRCFNYGAAWLFGLLPSLFLRDMLICLSPNSFCVPGQLQHYSPLLHCSILTFASSFSDDANIRSKDIRGRLARHTKQWLDEEFSYFNPSLMFSLILLSEHHIGIGENNTGYMYMGMAMRASRAQKLMAHEMQRPSEMPIPVVPIVPPVCIELSGRSTTGDTIEDMFSDSDYMGIAIHCYIQNAKLILISSNIPNALQSGRSPIDVHLQLDTWFNSVPNNLLVRQRSTLTQPPILALHIRYWWSILDLHLPHIDISDHGTSQSLKMCTRAAEKLVRLFGSYETQFGFRYYPHNLLQVGKDFLERSRLGTE
ncbi:Fungal Zn(2)-Cys(6) binuclear cluster domain [Rhizoctonia solani]|uniref:Fungal Zn(2)-Cys(6) binuclear cluster domain n=1 Tax=Rhizoctonia solani TaxID=456999 RepID=A0A8H8SVZ2_9AGAM|nr:Fungal Zn(2)-Cys(6) binuclear cluster domain [Rhizoctonia solani]QRW20486.1 Fungal Zn(2)-Cys(6) binuclear cluster domain [Rhizoctonia solani]